MLNQNHPYGIRFAFLASLFLISACGSSQAPETDAQSSESNGIESEVVAEASPGEASDNANASNTTLNEEETGIADLREIVDEIAPLSENEPDSSDPTVSGASASGTKQNSSSGNTKTDTPTTDAQENPAFMVALATGGLQTVDVQTGSTLDILFEVDRDIAVSTLSAAFGDPRETVKTNECPAGPLEITTWPNGFSLNTLDETFVGWSLRPDSESETLTTIAGVGIGTVLSDVQAAYEVEIFESSLGAEFSVGQMSGLLSSNQPDGEITHLWAGLNCIFR